MRFLADPLKACFLASSSLRFTSVDPADVVRIENENSVSVCHPDAFYDSHTGVGGAATGSHKGAPPEDPRRLAQRAENNRARFRSR